MVVERFPHGVLGALTAATCYSNPPDVVELSFVLRDSAHNGLNATRCLCVVFVNASTSTVQFLEMR